MEMSLLTMSVKMKKATMIQIIAVKIHEQVKCETVSVGSNDLLYYSVVCAECSISWLAVYA